VLNAGIRGYSGARGVLGALKARAPQAQLVEELLGMSDAESCASRLRALSFLEGVESGAGQADLERALRTACIVFGKKLTRFLAGPAGGFIETLLLRYGAYNLKVLFREALTKRVGAGGMALYPLAPFYVSGRQRATLDTVEKVASLAEGTKLGEGARLAYEVYKERGEDLFFFEFTLDREYASLLWSAAERVNLTEGHRLRERLVIPYLGTNAIVWGLWLKRYRGMGAVEIMNLLPVPAGVMNPASYLRLVQAKEPGEVAGAIESARLLRFLGKTEVPADVSAWQKTARRFVWETVSARDLGIIFDISTLAVALVRWELIVDDCITVASGKGLGLAREQIEPLLATRAA